MEQAAKRLEQRKTDTTPTAGGCARRGGARQVGSAFSNLKAKPTREVRQPSRRRQYRAAIREFFQGEAEGSVFAVATP